MKELTGTLREKPLEEIEGIKVVRFEDYQRREIYEGGKKVGTIDLPVSDVLKFICEDTSTVEVRPSGTEPKIKFYVEAVAKTKEELSGKFERMLLSLEKTLGLK
jgi:phosphoglucomutase